MIKLKQSHILLFLLLGVAMGFVGCKSGKQATAPVVEEASYLSSKVVLTVPHKAGNTLTVNGTMKLKSGELMQLSFLMPILRTEVARIELSPQEVLLVDRMGRRYVRATRDELKSYLPKKADFAHLEKLLFDAAKPGGKRSLSGKELGLSSLEKAAIELSDFSSTEFTITPTQLSAKYRQVPMEELLEMLLSLTR